MITVRELADELGVTPYALGQVANLHSWAEDATVPDDLAAHAREMLSGQASETPEPVPTSTPGDNPMVTAMREHVAKVNEPLTLENYEPHPFVDSAIDALIYVAGTSLGRKPEAQVSATFVVTGIILDDLITQGVTPFASEPGVCGEPDRDASTAITTWALARMHSARARKFAKALSLSRNVKVTIFEL